MAADRALPAARYPARVLTVAAIAVIGLVGRGDGATYAVACPAPEAPYSPSQQPSHVGTTIGASYPPDELFSEAHRLIAQVSDCEGVIAVQVAEDRTGLAILVNDDLVDPSGVPLPDEVRHLSTIPVTVEQTWMGRIVPLD